MIKFTPSFIGRIHVIKRDREGNVTFDKKMNNVVLDNGVKALFSRTVTTSSSITSYSTMAFAAMRFLFLGTGTSEPSSSDSGLESRSGTLFGKAAEGGTGSGFGDTGWSNWPDMPRQGYADPENHYYWTECTFEFRYGEGEAEGVWTELGLASDTDYSAPFSRALIRDESGAPISLTVLSDEYLSVFYTVRYVDGMGVPQTGTINVGGIDYQWTAKQNPGDSSGGWLATGTRARNTSYLGFWSENSPFRSISPYENFRSGYYPAAFSRSSSFDDAAMTVNHQLTFDPTNEDYQVGYLAMGHASHNRLGTLYGIEFTPPIPKKADFAMTISVDVSVSNLGKPVEGLEMSSATSTTLDFTWEAYPDATEYALVLRQAGTVIEEQTVTAPTTTASFTGLTADTEYHLDIQPKASGRDGARSIHAATTGAA